MALKETTNSIRKLLSQITHDLEKADKGNKAASQRVRTNTVRLEKAAKVYRKESIANDKKNKGTRKVAKKAAPAKKTAAKKAAPAKKASSATKAPATKAKAKTQKAAARPRAFSVKRATAKIPSKAKRASKR